MLLPPRLLVLVSQGREHSVLLSLTDPDPQPSAPEAAVQHLLRAFRLPLAQLSSNSVRASSRRTPSFLSDSQPRDRRGRIGEKPKNIKTSLDDPGPSVRRPPILRRKGGNGDFGHDDYVLVEDDEFGEETPRIRKGGWAGVMQDLYFDEEREREREREFLEALRCFSSLPPPYPLPAFSVIDRTVLGVLISKITRTTGEASAVGDWVTPTKRIRRRNTLWRTRKMSWIGTKPRAWSRGWLA